MRCTNFDKSYYSVIDDKGWYGVEMITETGDRQSLIKRVASNTLKPTMLDSTGTPMAFPVVTRQNWQISCLPSTANGQPGEAFLAVAPNGTKYRFDRLVYYGANNIYETVDGVIVRQRRRLATMYVSRIEDRFGNFVDYRYNTDGTLKEIAASDGRFVSVAWRTDQRLIDHITLQPALATPQTWHYEYSDIGATTATLSAVVLPDGSRWTFDLHGIGGGGSPDANLKKCNVRTLANATTQLLSTITSPTGLVGKFWTAKTWHGRNYVPSACMYAPFPSEAEPWEDTPPLFGTSSLVQREFSGPGFATQTWTYTYEPALGSTTSDPCAATSTCATTKWVKMVDPDGNLTTYTYSNRWDATEGKVKQIDYYQGTTGAPLKTELFEYAAYNQGPWPVSLGTQFDDPRSNTIKAVTFTPEKKRTVIQQGRKFVWEATSFDTFARPTTITKSSAPSP